MPDEMKQPGPPEIPPGWSVPKAEPIPEPSIWPATLAVGITCLLWGLVTSMIITGVGVLLFAAALAGWIGGIRHDRAQ
jgi:hypothetical protein